MSTEILFRPYMDSFGVAAPYAKPLGRLMRNAAPHDLDREEDRQLERIEDCAQEIQDILAARDKLSTANIRDPLLDYVGRMSALHTALTATSNLPVSAGTRGGRAKKVLASYFPDGIAFTKLDAYAAWSEGSRRVEQFEKDGMAAEIVALTGPEFLPVLNKSIKVLGDAIGVGKIRRESPETTLLSQKLVEYSREVALYCRILSAKVREDDESSVERFRKAVAPIDQYRASSRRGGNDTEEPIDPSEDPLTPTPDQDVDPEPAAGG